MNKRTTIFQVPGAVILWLMIGLFAGGGAWGAASEAGDASNVYNLPVKPLTTLECAQCHLTVFNAIRDGGGKHQLNCTECHQTFHTMKPGVAWKDAVPKCEGCHGNLHGAGFEGCLECHLNAHAPIKSLTDLNKLASNCDACHDSQTKELSQFTSKHSLLPCTDCHHTRHGTMPGCAECHAPSHTPFVSNSGCLGCHPVHSPKKILYGEDVPNTVCGDCHDGVAATLAASPRKHASLPCVYCHSERHGNVPECQSCHSKPHSDAMLKKFTGCQACHGDPHALALPAD